MAVRFARARRQDDTLQIAAPAGAGAVGPVFLIRAAAVLAGFWRRMAAVRSARPPPDADCVLKSCFP
jgi:ABC-type lipoprotein release transport system permease subunit